MSEKQEMTLLEKANAVLGTAYGGLHHVNGKIHDRGRYIEVTVPSGLSTFDFDVLTRLVVAAHDQCVRLEIAHSAPRSLKLMFHNRQRTGRLYERHPTMEEAIENVRGEKLASVQALEVVAQEILTHQPDGYADPTWNAGHAEPLTLTVGECRKILEAAGMKPEKQNVQTD